MISDIENSKLTNLRYLAIHKIQQFNIFDKNKLILYPKVRNSIT